MTITTTLPQKVQLTMTDSIKDKMLQVQSRATLHESTVKDAEKHANRNTTASKSSKRKRTNTKHRNASTPVTQQTVDRRVWKKANELAHGDKRRIKIINATEVIVLNPPHSKD
jgi:hypothetical protein